jgi:hypothetical protein
MILHLLKRHRSQFHLFMGLLTVAQDIISSVTELGGSEFEAQT